MSVLEVPGVAVRESMPGVAVRESMPVLPWHCSASGLVIGLIITKKHVFSILKIFIYFGIYFNLFGHSFMADLHRRIYSNIHSLNI